MARKGKFQGYGAVNDSFENTQSESESSDLEFEYKSRAMPDSYEEQSVNVKLSKKPIEIKPTSGKYAEISEKSLDVQTSLKATLATEQQMSAFIGRQRISRNSSPFGRSMPTAIPSSIPKGNSLPRGSFQGKSNSYSKGGKKVYHQDSDSDREIAEIVGEHLVQVNNDTEYGVSFGSVSHSLVGGAITREIYKWQEDWMEPPVKRSRSVPDLPSMERQDGDTVANIREPGGFRRQFIESRNREAGKSSNFLTKNFIDFLVLYGHYGGDVYPSDDESEYDNEIGEMEIDGADENTSLLRPANLLPRGSSMSFPEVQHTSQSKAYFMLLKAFVGTGVLFLPKAFVNGGLLFAIASMIFMGVLTCHCMILLTDASRHYGGKSFGDIGLVLYGENCRLFVLGSIALSQMIILPDWFFIVIQMILYIPLAWVRRIKNFGITSLIGDVFIMGGLGYIFLYDTTIILQKGIQPVSMINLQSFPLFIGTAMFAFEGICLMLPIAESMQEPEKFSNVVISALTTIAVIFLSVGSVGYLANGEKSQTVAFLNLPTTPLVTGIQFLYSLAIMLSFPLTIYPAIRITEQGIFGVSTGKRSPLVKWQKNLYRAILTIVLGLIGWAGSTSLDKVVSLVGCLCCIPLSFIFPALFHLNISENKWIRFKDWLIVLFGVVATFYTTYITLLQWAISAPDIPLDRCNNPSFFVEQ